MEQVSTNYLSMMKSPLRERAYARLFLECYDESLASISSVTRDGVTFRLTDVNESNYIDISKYSNLSIASNTYWVSSGKNLILKFAEGSYPKTIKYIIKYNSLGGTKVDDTVITWSGKPDENNCIWLSLETETYLPNSLTLEFSNMVGTPKLIGMLYGSKYTFTGDDIVNSTFTADFSYSNSTLPQLDLSVELYNSDGRYNYITGTTEGESFVDMLSKGGKIRLDYGQDITGKGDVEWVKGYELAIDSYNISSTLTITGVDNLRGLTKPYNNQKLTTYQERYIVDIIKSIFEEAGIDKYYIPDEILLDLNGRYINYLGNPVGKYTEKEVLQQICSYCDLTLKIERDGTIAVLHREDLSGAVTWFDYITENGKAAAVGNYYLYHEEVVRFGKDFIPTVVNYDEGCPVTYKHRDGLETGWFSENISETDGTLKYPITIHFDIDDVNIHRVELEDGYNKWSELKLSWVDVDDVVHTFTSKRNSYDSNVIAFNGKHCKSIDITITKVRFGEAPIYISTNTNANLFIAFNIEPNDVLSEPKIEKLPTIRSLTLHGYRYWTDYLDETMQYTTTTAYKAGDTVTIYSDLPLATASSVDVPSGNTSVSCSIKDAYVYYVTFIAPTDISANTKLVLHRWKYDITNVTDTDIGFQRQGVDVSVTNPFAEGYYYTDDRTFINNVKRDYNKYDISYGYRGDPEIDVGDLIHEKLPNETYYSNAMITHIEINFAQALSGTITTRRGY